MFYGCGCSCAGGNTVAYYFNIVKTSFVCTVGENFNIFNEEIKTNLSSYEHMHIYSEDNKIAKVLEDKTMDILTEGKVSVIVSGYFQGQFISDSFSIISNYSNVDGGGVNNPDSEDRENGIFTTNILLDTTNDKRVVVYQILKDGVGFVDFTIDERSLKTGIKVNKFHDTIEVIYEMGENFSINILDKNLNIILVLELD